MSNKFWMLILTLPLLVNCGGLSGLSEVTGSKATGGGADINAALQPDSVRVNRGVSSTGMHIFADDPSVITAAGYALEGPAFQVEQTYVAGLVGLHRCVASSGYTFLSVDKGCESASSQPAQVIGFISIEPSATAATGLYRYHNMSGDHMTTHGQNPGLAKLGYVLDGLMGYVP